MALRPGDFVVGPGGARAARLVGGLTSTTVHFPRALGTPAASCQPPLFAFARSFHLHLLPHYLLLIVSGESVSPSVCLSVSLSFSPYLSLSFSFFPLLLISTFLPVFLHLGAIEIKELTHPWLFSRESVCRFTFTRRCRDCHGNRARARTHIVYSRKYQPFGSEDDRQRVADDTPTHR